MSYTFSLGQGEESLAECFSDIPAYVLSRLSLTPGECSSSGSETASFHASPSGTTSAPLTDYRGVGTSMSSAEDSPARTSVQPERAQESTASAADSGERWRGSFARYDHGSHSWKTHQCSLLGGFTEFSETWPRWGTMRDGACWEHPTPERRTSESGSGFWPTPSSNKQTASGALINADGTPWDGVSKPHSATTGKPVQTALLDKVRQWPTPTVQDAKNNGGPSQLIRNTKPLNAEVRVNADGGLEIQPMELNPDWVEWLMGWGIGWTDLRPLETARFQQWLRLHGACSEGSDET